MVLDCIKDVDGEVDVGGAISVSVIVRVRVGVCSTLAGEFGVSVFWRTNIRQRETK